MSTIFRGTAEAESGRRALEHQLAGATPSPAPPQLTAGQLRELCQELGAEPPEPAATARGPLPAWMDLLVHAAAGNPTPAEGLTITGDVPKFDRLLQALR